MPMTREILWRFTKWAADCLAPPSTSATVTNNKVDINEEVVVISVEDLSEEYIIPGSVLELYRLIGYMPSDNDDDLLKRLIDKNPQWGEKKGSPVVTNQNYEDIEVIVISTEPLDNYN